MQAFDRSEEETPAYLRGEEAKRSRQQMATYMLTDPARRNQMDSPRSILKFDDINVTEALNRLFRGKCAFCEARRTRPYQGARGRLRRICRSPAAMLRQFRPRRQRRAD